MGLGREEGELFILPASRASQGCAGPEGIGGRCVCGHHSLLTACLCIVSLSSWSTPSLELQPQISTWLLVCCCRLQELVQL